MFTAVSNPSLTVPRNPECCRPEAYRAFVNSLSSIHTTIGLVKAAVAISMHALDDVDPHRVENRLQLLSLRVRGRCTSGNPTAIQANLHAVLFEEEQFAGNLEHYYNALNGYLPAVLSSRRGLPALLSLIYKAVGEGCGLTIQGINAPGHFMVRVRCDQSWMIVDPFFGGQMLTREEAFRRLERVNDRKLARKDEYLATASHEEWITRILGNLRQLFATEGRLEDLAAMVELTNALEHYKAYQESRGEAYRAAS